MRFGRDESQRRGAVTLRCGLLLHWHRQSAYLISTTRRIIAARLPSLSIYALHDGLWYTPTTEATYYLGTLPDPRLGDYQSPGIFPLTSTMEPPAGREDVVHPEVRAHINSLVSAVS